MQQVKRALCWKFEVSRHLAVLVAICCACALPSVASAAPAHVAQPLSARRSATHPYMACPLPSAHNASCLTVIVPPAAHLLYLSRYAAASPATGGIEGSGLAPTELQSAYNLPSSTGGSGETVGLVDAYDDPAAESDLAAYRSAYGLGACTKSNGCFSKVNQTGGTSYPSSEPGWGVEISLDIDMVSAICPKCHILLVEANSSSMSDLMAAESEAVKLGATAISNSWGSPEFSSETAFDSTFVHPGIPIAAASGDWGYNDHEMGASAPSYPAASPNVIAVGGTVLTAAENSRGWSESVWTRSGSGCSHYEPKPSYQHDSGCSHRMLNDVSAVAENLSIYDSSQSPAWFTVGGTSAASPIVAAAEALSSSTARSLGAAAFYQSPSSLFDITSGSNGSCGGTYLCTAGAGYDGPTGIGTPNGLFPAEKAAPTVTSISPAEGTTLGATAVTIKGTGFLKGATVTIGRAATSVTVKSETEITAKTAAGPAGADEVVVNDSNGTSSTATKYTYVTPPPPTVTSTSPTEGTTLGATTVTITGTHFLKGASVKIGHSAATVTVKSETEIVVKTAPTSAGADEVVVTDTNGISTAGAKYTYVAPPPPTVTSVSPDEGTTLGGTAVTIKGTGFLKGATVKIGHAASSVTVKSETEITAKTSATSAGSDEVVVSDAAGTSSGGAKYTYVAPPKPTVTSISPAEGTIKGGASVTIKGTGFLKGATVKIDHTASSVVVKSETEITAKTAATPAGTYEVVVTDTDGTSSGGAKYTYTAP